MSKTFRSTVAFAAATIAVFGVVYLIDGAGLKPLNKPKPVQEIKGSVGPVWTVGDGAALESPDDDSTGKALSGRNLRYAPNATRGRSMARNSMHSRSGLHPAPSRIEVR